jgi:peptidoglycan/LPS O-acetylase OafA/YrhL
LGEAVLPFYLLHQTVLLSVAWLLLDTSLPALVKFLMITVLSFCIILALYEFIVRRFQGLRFLFGMRAADKRSAP